jgi:beta-glucanase (GH16 family)
MSLIKKIIKAISSLFKSKPKITSLDFYKDHTLIVEDPCNELHSIWEVAVKGPSSWNLEAGLNPTFEHNTTDGNFIRLFAVKANTEHGFKTAALRSKETYGDGMFECEARFKGGNATYPAIWMTHPNGSLNNYESYFEIDISEYYEERDETEVTLHVPESMRDGSRYCFLQEKVPIKKDGWNKFRCIWNDKAITVYINDIKALEFTNNGNPNQYPLQDFQREMKIILSMQIHPTSKWLKPYDVNQLPLWMDVRNIKIYKKK